MFRRKRRARDFAEEIKAHLEFETERLREEGLDEREAWAGAPRLPSLGGLRRLEGLRFCRGNFGSASFSCRRFDPDVQDIPGILRAAGTPLLAGRPFRK